MSFLMTELIKAKRDGRALTRDEISFIIDGYTNGSIPDYQMSAFLMATYLRGMTTEESHILTDRMLHSGRIVDMSHIASQKVDKHSTGGVGDKTSLILAPIVAAAGVAVPMISGRGLGHTGGTLDKLESIPGFNTQLDLETFRRLTASHGLCFIGQTKEICPADKKIYALRDVTGTIESLPLICASIMSKKIAEGIDGLVLDVKVGTGAFMKTLEDADRLSDALIAIGQKAGKKVVAFLTDMRQPLGYKIGNALEIEECIEILKGLSGSEKALDTRDLSVQLAGAMIWLGEKAGSLSDGVKKAEALLSSGQAFEFFERICIAQGGDLSKLPRATHTHAVAADGGGFVVGLNTELIGIAGIVLGAGRKQSSDVIDPIAGIVSTLKIGTKVQRGDLLFELRGSSSTKFKDAEVLLRKAVVLADTPVAASPLILQIKGA